MPLNVIDTLKPKNGLDFPIVEAIDVFVEGYTSLADAVTHFATNAMIAAINTALSGKANTADVNSSVANLQGQIDQIVISSSAESVVAPEVAAARVGTDGTSYSTLKERLDANETDATAKINDVTSYAEQLKETLDNSFTTDALSIPFANVTGRIIEPDGEITTTTTSFGATDYIDIESFDFLNLTSMSGFGKCYFAFYDTSYNFISGKIATGSQSTTFTGSVPVPEDAKYIVIENAQQLQGITKYIAIPDDTKEATEAVIGNISYTPEPLEIIIETSKTLTIEGEIVDYSGHDSYTVTTVDVSALSTILITASANFNSALYVIEDVNHNVLSYEQADGTSTASAIKDKVIVLPQNAKYVKAENIVTDTRPSIVIADAVLGLIANDITEELEAEINTMIEEGIPSEIIENSEIVENNKAEIATPIELTIETEKLLSITGVISDYEGHTNYQVTTVDVSEYTVIQISASANFRNALYVIEDENHNVLSYEQAEAGSSPTEIVNKTVALPSNAKYCKAANIKTDTRPSVGISSVVIGLVASELTQDLYNKIEATQFQGKKWVVLGDSLTEHNSRTTMNYHDYVAAATGVTVVNMGRSGSGYMRQQDNDRAFYQIAENIPLDADVITIFGSGNDNPLVGDSLGTPTDTGTETICGCINTTIDTIIGLIPDISLGIVSPTPWASSPPTLDDTNVMGRYSEALRQICYLRSIPYLDLYHCSNLRPWTQEGREACYSKDDGNGVHPDENGHRLIASRFKAFVNSLLI